MNAEVAQLVEHHLAKVRVAGSSPVFRSEYALKPRPTTAANYAGVMGSALPPRERSRAARFASPRATRRTW